MTHTMMIRFSMYFWLFLSTVLFASPAVGGSQAQRSKPAPAHAPAAEARKIDVCQMLTSAEIAAAQGDPVKSTSPTSQSNGAMAMSQCLYQTATPAKSVNLLVVTRISRSKGLSPREYWRQKFHEAANERDPKPAPHAFEKSKAGEESEMSAPRRMRGLGDEAYWLGSSVTGALYILHGEMFLRVSVGGGGPEATRIKNSAALARIALKHL